MRTGGEFSEGLETSAVAEVRLGWAWPRTFRCRLTWGEANCLLFRCESGSLGTWTNTAEFEKPLLLPWLDSRETSAVGLARSRRRAAKLHIQRKHRDVTMHLHTNHFHLLTVMGWDYIRHTTFSMERKVSPQKPTSDKEKGSQRCSSIAMHAPIPEVQLAAEHDSPPRLYALVDPSVSGTSAVGRRAVEHGIVTNV